MKRHIPNMLTMARVILAACFFALLEFYRYPGTHQWAAWAGVAVFLIAVLTDAFDGYLARRWHVVSKFGRVMDPVCDKLLIIGGFVYLAGPAFRVSFEGQAPTGAVTGVALWMVIVILSRELLVTGLRTLLEAQGIAFGANWSGKAKMILQSAAIPTILGLILLFDPIRHAWVLTVCRGLAYVTVFVTVISIVPYLSSARAALADQTARGTE
ncbi:MAG: CDP-diacylglycerol--glycerol-3-phosphate 3-phosphatidyltransferase [Planctomycetes bacterium]|nr:CDP-diacylglycerol--glycerol-3-phosphate 3-phosphatidyltransferase [Planctomycetota bacterium]